MLFALCDIPDCVSLWDEKGGIVGAAIGKGKERYLYDLVVGCE